MQSALVQAYYHPYRGMLWRRCRARWELLNWPSFYDWLRWSNKYKMHVQCWPNNLQWFEWTQIKQRLVPVEIILECFVTVDNSRSDRDTGARRALCSDSQSDFDWSYWYWYRHTGCCLYRGSACFSCNITVWCAPSDINVHFANDRYLQNRVHSPCQWLVIQARSLLYAARAWFMHGRSYLRF